MCKVSVNDIGEIIVADCKDSYYARL
uniref:Uncharacterized protein n=1 Tax=Arundo donax TaxID=35708 RepID=A0A0A9FZX8_ARUDO